MAATASITAPARPFDFGGRLREIDMFFAGNDAVHQTMHRVADRLEKAQIAYAIAGDKSAPGRRQFARVSRDGPF